ncbi:kinase-like protein [Aspergillus homomorphus CBS 101889]|uniref:Kinase-like protein n=1 Tax=Aspergillus homomorphus (strain CBS 101889) TaxID=1450537 RepID=A0A395HH19_ASPHC|nr:kinase-like protein [Aspergillus homomorphus CBS 101889]RAL06783.1 kinase-like protein [Aspergillus homomorphus CBS 101889]
MLQWLVPRLLLPSFTWSDHEATVLSDQLPPVPQATHPRIRQFWGIVHKYLRRFSRSYCSWVGVAYDNQIAQLPFGLILKWSDGTRLEEVLAMQVARKAGLPVPKVICYGEHADTPHAPVSILMTRLPGKELGQIYEALSNEEKDAVSQQLDQYLTTIRNWKNPWGESRICSLLGTPLRSVRVPNHLAGPFESEQELNDYLIKPAWSGGFSSEKAYSEALNRARRIDKLRHRVVFTHGDLQHHNIMIHRGRITGFLDWESAGWYPEYWEFTTALRFAQENFWWYQFVIELGGKSYLLELDCERALTSLTSASYYW